MCCFNQIFHPHQGDVTQNNTTDPSGQLYSFKRVLHVYKIEYVQTMFHFSMWLKNALHILQITNKLEGAAYIKGVILKSFFCFGGTPHYVFREMMFKFKGHISHAYICSVFLYEYKNTYCENGIAWAIGSIFDIEHRSRHVLPQWNALTSEKQWTCWRGQ